MRVRRPQGTGKRRRICQQDGQICFHSLQYDNLTDFRYCYHVVPQVKVHLVTYVYLKWKIPVSLLSRTTSQLQSALSLKDYKVLSAAYKEQGLEKTLMKAHGIKKH